MSPKSEPKKLLIYFCTENLSFLLIPQENNNKKPEFMLLTNHFTDHFYFFRFLRHLQHNDTGTRGIPPGGVTEEFENQQVNSFFVTISRFLIHFHHFFTHFHHPNPNNFEFPASISPPNPITLSRANAPPPAPTSHVPRSSSNVKIFQHATGRPAG